MIYIFPTDTVYGIGCSIFDKENQNRIYEIKKRPRHMPLAVLCADVSQIEKIAYIDNQARLLISKFMPGALTIIVKAKEDIVDITGFDTIGVRIPNCNLALELLKKEGPMTTTSVNESGSTPINEYEIIIQEYSDKVEKIIPPTPNMEFSKISSTVIDITSSNIKLVRPGEITLEEILKSIE